MIKGLCSNKVHDVAEKVQVDASFSDTDTLENLNEAGTAFRQVTSMMYCCTAPKTSISSKRAITLLEVIAALIILALASGLALFSIPKARARYSDSRIKATAQTLLHRAVEVSAILNNECTLTIGQEDDHKIISLKISGLPTGAIRKHFETSIALPSTITDVYFEENNKRTESLRILPLYTSERPELSLNINSATSNTISVSIASDGPRLAPLGLPDEVHQARSVAGSEG